MKRPRVSQDGFGVIEILIVCVIVAVLVTAGVVFYRHSHKINTKKDTALTTSQTTPQQATTSNTQIPQTAVQYLYIKEWGVQLPLSDGIKDAYYTVKSSNIGSDGLPNTAWLGLTSTNSSGCDISGTGPTSVATPIGSIIRATRMDRDPVTGNLYTQQNTDGIMAGNYYYAYLPWKNKTCTPQKSIDSDFSAAARGIVSATTSTH